MKPLPTHLRENLEAKALVAETFANTEKANEYIAAYYTVRGMIENLGYNLSTIKDLDKQMMELRR
ncbi:unnamed protein product [marine sediment metagenome]|uniref:Uncharacterized protein n=1 Tax=marine sediment metagenome TaxID=412755 RepID=X1SAG1_9ZZZZ